MGSICSSHSGTNRRNQRVDDGATGTSSREGIDDDDIDSVTAVYGAAVNAAVVVLSPREDTTAGRWDNQDDSSDGEKREWEHNQPALPSNTNATTSSTVATPQYPLESPLRSTGSGYRSVLHDRVSGGDSAGRGAGEEDALLFTPDRPSSPVNGGDSEECQNNAPSLAIFQKLSTSEGSVGVDPTTLPISSTYPLSDDEMQFSQTHDRNVIPASTPRLHRRQHLSWFKVNSASTSRGSDNSIHSGSVRLHRSVTFVDADEV